MNSLEILLQRREEGWRHGDDDGNIVYASVDGGAMTSIVSLGALHQLSEEGLLDYVDGAAGSSGGSGNLAYGFSGKTLEVRNAFTDYFASNVLMSRTHPDAELTESDGDVGPFLKVPLPYINMQALRYTMTDIAPLDWDHLANDPRELMIGVSNLTQGKADFYTNHQFKPYPPDMIEALLTGGRIPGFSIGHQKQGDDVCADAFIFWPSSDAIARERPVTHVLTLASQPKPETINSLSQRLGDAVLSRYCARFSEAGKQTIKTMAKHRNELLTKFALSDTIEIDGASVTRIYPDNGELPNRQTTDPKVLNAGFEAGRRAVAQALTPYCLWL